MKMYAKSLKEYKNVAFDEKKIVAFMKQLKTKRKQPTSVALEARTILELKGVAETKGVPYQVLMRMFILDGLRKMKKAA